MALSDPLVVSQDDLDLDDTTATDKGVQDKVTDELGAGDDDVVILDDDKGDRKGAGDDDLRVENAKLRQQLLDLGSEIRDMKVQLEESARGAKDVTPRGTPPTGDDEITDEQLAALIKEHGDNPAVIVRIMRHLSQTEGRKIALGIRDETVRNVEYQNWHRDLKRTNDAVMVPIFQNNPDMEKQVNDTSRRLALEEHPMGQLLVHFMLEGIKRQRDEARVEDDKTRAEKIAKVKGMDKTREGGDKGSKGGVRLSQEQLEVARRFNLKPELYAKFVQKEGA